MTDVVTTSGVRDEYLAFARGQAAGVSPSYEALARAVAADAHLLALLADLPPAKRQPNLLFGVVRQLGGPVMHPADFRDWLVATGRRYAPSCWSAAPRPTRPPAVRPPPRPLSVPSRSR